MKFLQPVRHSASPGRGSGRKITAEQEAARIARNFKVVRVGLSMSFTVFLLLAFSMVYLNPEDAAFYAGLMALAANGLLFGGLILLARRTAARWHKREEESA